MAQRAITEAKQCLYRSVITIKQDNTNLMLAYCAIRRAFESRTVKTIICA
jgi:hypothetical protein